MKQYWLKVSPIAKPRQTRSDKWKQRPVVLAYRAFADRLRAEAKRTNLTLPADGMDVFFYLPMPASWSARKRREMGHAPHQQTPDIDNLLKAVFDALCKQDCHIWRLGRVEKRWAETGVINILTNEAEEDA